MRRDLVHSMKTTAVVLVITPDLIQWGAYRGQPVVSDLREWNKNIRERVTISLVQILCDTERSGNPRSVRTRIGTSCCVRVGAQVGTKTYDISAVVERGETQAFVLMTDGFWEYVYEEEMLATYKEASSAQAWLDAMGKYVLKRADMTKTDNYSAIVVRVEE